MSRQVLVLQVRDDALPLEQERTCFRRSIGAIGEARFWNLATNPSIDWKDASGANVLVIGGAGAHSATQQYDFTEPLFGLVRRWIDEGRPLFGSCWGHHLLAVALGGSVVTDEASEEVGTFDIHLTPAGAADSLLVDMPSRFKGQLGHHDRIERLPEGAIELAFSDRCRNQMLRLVDRPVYGTQFHPEMTDGDLRERLGMYSDEYLQPHETESSTSAAPSVSTAQSASTTTEERTSRIVPSPEAGELLRRFLIQYA